MIEVVATAGDGEVELRFVLPADHPGGPVGVAGDFNDWDWTRAPLEPHGDDVWAVVTVAAGQRYQFRYRGANATWFNDDKADDYVPNEFGGVNCLIDLTDASAT